MAALSILGLGAMFGIVNTIIRGVIYDGAIGIARRDAIIHASEIDTWFESSARFVGHLTTAWRTTGIAPGAEHGIDPLAASFVEESDFFMEVYVGFESGRFVGGSGWIPEPDWDPTTRPWYVAAMAAPGETVTVLPFLHDETGELYISAVAKWVPDLDGMEAVVAVGIRLERITEMLERSLVAGGGYLVLLGPDGEIISHPNHEYNPSADGLLNLRDIPNGDLLMGVIASGGEIERFDDFRLGLSYFMVFPLKTAGWTLAAVMPVAVTQEPVVRSLSLIMVTLALLLIALFAFTMFFVSRIARSMEESGVAEERLRIIFDNMPLASNFSDRDFNVMECNAEAPKMFDLRDKQEYLDRFFDLSPEFQPDGVSSHDKSRRHMAAAFETGRQRFEWMHRKLDGEPIPCEVTLTRVNFQGGDFLLAFVRDLREFYESRERERLLMQRMQALLDSSPLMCLIFDEQSNVLEANREVERLLEISDKQIFIDNFFDFSPEVQLDGTSSREKAVAEIQKAFETGRARYEWVYQTPSGTQIPCEEILAHINLEGRDLVVAYTRDLRDFYKYRETERLAQQRLQAMLDSSPLICAIFDENINVIEVNEEVVPLLGLADKRDYIERFFDLAPERQPDGVPSREKAIAEIGRALETGENYLEWTHKNLAGELVPVDVRLRRVRLGDKNFIIGHGRDLRDFYKYRETEHIAQQRLQSMLDSSPLACSIIDEGFNVLEVNKEMLKLLGLADAGAFIDCFLDFSPTYQPDGRLSGEKLAEKTRLAIETGRSHFEWMHQTLDGKTIPCEKTIVPVTIEGKKMLIAYTRDLREINHVVAMVKQLETLAFTDALTGARNRRYFNEAAERELRLCASEERGFALVMFDIDHFKRVNDTYGHDVGDEVLKIVVARTCHTLKKDTLVARYGGEEFIVMLTGISRANAVKIAEQIRKRIGETPFMTSGPEITVTVSLGVASKAAGFSALQDIVKNADRALYQAKGTGRNKVVSFDDMPDAAPGA